MHSETPRQRAEVGAMLLQSRHTGERWETPDIGRGGASWEPAVKSLFSACERRNSEVEGPSCRKLQEQLHRTLPLTAPFCRARCTPDQGTRSPCSPPSAGRAASGLAAVVQRMPVLNAEVAMALSTRQLQHLLLPASLFGTAVCENLQEHSHLYEACHQPRPIRPWHWAQWHGPMVLTMTPKSPPHQM